MTAWKEQGEQVVHMRDERRYTLAVTKEAKITVTRYFVDRDDLSTISLLVWLGRQEMPVEQAKGQAVAVLLPLVEEAIVALRKLAEETGKQQPVDFPAAVERGKE